MMKPMDLPAAVLAVASVAGAIAREKYPGAEYDEGTNSYLDDVLYILRVRPTGRRRRFQGRRVLYEAGTDPSQG